MAVCAGCGRELLHLLTGRWFDVDGSGTCRHTMAERDDGMYLVSADYHYVAGETQQHWPEKEA